MHPRLVVVAGIAGVLIVGAAAYWWLAREGDHAASSTSALQQGGTFELRGGGQPAGARVEGREAGSVGEQRPGEGALAASRSGGAQGVAALKPRGSGVGEAVGGEREGGQVEITALSGETAEKVQSLKPTHGVAGQAQIVAAGEPGSEPPPEVAFESGRDKRYVTETQVPLEGVGKIAGDAGSMAFWLKPDWQSNDQNDAVFVQIGEGNQAIRVAKNVNFLRFEFFDADGRERGVGVPIDEWKPGEWHQVTATWVQGRLQLFVDGKPVSQNTFDVAPNLGEEPRAFVGSKLPSGTPAAGEMTDVRILNRPLQPAEIEQLARSDQKPQ